MSKDSPIYAELNEKNQNLTDERSELVKTLSELEEELDRLEEESKDPYLRNKELLDRLQRYCSPEVYALIGRAIES